MSITKISGLSGVLEHEPAPEELAKQTTATTSTSPRGDQQTIALRTSLVETIRLFRASTRRKTEPSHQRPSRILRRFSWAQPRDELAAGQTNRQEMKTSWHFHEMNRLATDNRRTVVIKPFYSEPPSARLLLAIRRLPTTTTKITATILLRRRSTFNRRTKTDGETISH
jgi:hypothetical protein